MKNNFNVEISKDSILLNDRWEMYNDGVIYDTKCGTDIPMWVFMFRDFVIKNYKTIKSNQ